MRTKMPEQEALYRRYTTSCYGDGRPHPLKAPDEIRTRMAKTHPVWHKKIKKALAYAEIQKQKWIDELKEEESYLRSKGWTTIPYEHEEWLGDHDTWVSPRDVPDSPYHKEAGSRMSRLGAISLQCHEDGHILTKTSPEDVKEVSFFRCSRCRCSIRIDH